MIKEYCHCYCGILPLRLMDKCYYSYLYCATVIVDDGNKIHGTSKDINTIAVDG